MPISGNTHALMTSRLGVARLGATRLDVYQPWVRVLINGVDRTNYTRVSGAVIQQTIDGTPDTATLRVEGFVPVKGQEIKIYLGDTDTAHLLFAGHILTVTTTYEEVPTNSVYDLSCIDYTWMLNARKVIKKYTNQSATTIITNLISTYTTGITVRNVAAGLATLDELTLTNEDVTDVLDRIAQRIGGYWFLDYNKDLHVFLNATSNTTPVTDAMHMGVESVSTTVDLSQVRTVIWSRGGGSVTPLDIPAGANSLPVEDGAWYSSTGGHVESGPQRILYSGKSTMDGSSTTMPPAPTASPSAPAVVAANGTANTYVSGNLPEGTYRYKVTFVVDGVEGSAGPSGSLIIGGITAPINTTAVGLSSNTGGSLHDGCVYRYKFTYVTADGETEASSDGNNLYYEDGSQQTTLFGSAISLSNIPISPDGRVTGRRIYRTEAFVFDYRLVTTINDNSTTTYKDVMGDPTLSVQPLMPTTAGTQTGRGQLSAIAIGPSGTTARKIYRTVRNGTTYGLLTTINDNSTETYADNTADGSLGAAPATESVGASAGDTTLRLVDLSKVPASGWLRAGENLLRYTGRTASSGEGSVTGIPATGFGAILVNIPAGATVVVAPHLTGVSGIVYDIPQGDDVNVLTGVMDAGAVDALAAMIGGDGIVEDSISDGRISLAEAEARAFAKLEEVKDPVTTVSLTTRDQSFQVGRSTAFTLTNPAVNGTFKVQRVTISGIAEAASAVFHFPVRNVELSSRRFSFESLLRQLKAER